MAFDKTNTTHLIALRDEESLDPISMGYAAVTGQTQKTLSLFNTPSSNTESTSGQDFLVAEKLLEILFGEAISSQDQFKLQLLFEATNGLTDDLSQFKADVSALSGSLSTAISNNLRELSRAEVLFGSLDSNNSYERVIITKADWIAARDYVGG